MGMAFSRSGAPLVCNGPFKVRRTLSEANFCEAESLTAPRRNPVLSWVIRQVCLSAAAVS
jgi:hypothetical protein